MKRKNDFPSVIPISGLAYLGIAANDLEEWRQFAATILGIQAIRPDDETLVLRVDEKRTRILIEQGPIGTNNGCKYIGWSLSEGTGINVVTDCLDQHGIQYTFGSARECTRRAVESMVWFEDPAGNRIECCVGHLTAASPPEFTRPLAGFKTKGLGLGHVVLLVEEPAAAIQFYRQVLGFCISDSTERPFDATFLHVNSRHHSLAIIKSERTALHHLMLEMFSLDDVGQAYDLVHNRKVPLGASLGRHSNDYMTSFYVFTPSRFMIEVGWGGRLVDVENWTPEVLTCGPSLWGHERTWLPESLRNDAEKMRLQAAADGMKAPLQVSNGFFEEIP